MTQTKIQLRGHCQCCGKLQATTGTRMSKHGYTVQSGWFSGICSGQHHPAIEVSRAHADAVIAQIAIDVIALRAKADAYTAGEIHPEMVPTNRLQFVNGRAVRITVPFADADVYRQREAVKSAAWGCENRARIGEQFAKDLAAMCDEFHGKELVKVAK